MGRLVEFAVPGKEKFEYGDPETEELKERSKLRAKEPRQEWSKPDCCVNGNCQA